jgi:hypothetical protein
MTSVQSKRASKTCVSICCGCVEETYSSSSKSYQRSLVRFSYPCFSPVTFYAGSAHGATFTQQQGHYSQGAPMHDSRGGGGVRSSNHQQQHPHQQQLQQYAPRYDDHRSI